MLESILIFYHCRPLQRTLVSLAAVLSVSACVCACAQEGRLVATKDQDPACQPGLRLVTGRPFSARSGPLEVHAIAVIAGCKSKLETIAPDKEKELVSRVLAPFVLEQGGVTSRQAVAPQIKLVADINSVLDEDLVADAVVYRLSWTERIPGD